MSNHAKCPECKDYITPLDTIDGICSRCYVKREEEENAEEKEESKDEEIIELNGKKYKLLEQS